MSKSVVKNIVSVLLLLAFIAGSWAHVSDSSLAMSFRDTTPLFLFSLLLIATLYHPGSISRLLVSFITIYVLAMALEMLGVSTGFPFGQYEYGNALGPQISGVPWIIGINWMLLSYCALAFADLFHPRKNWIAVLLAAAAVLLLDVIMEIVAPHWDYWAFENGAPPIINYVSWFIACVIFMSIIVRTCGTIKNKMGAFIFVLLMFYFVFTSVTF